MKISKLKKDTCEEVRISSEVLKSLKKLGHTPQTLLDSAIESVLSISIEARCKFMLGMPDGHLYTIVVTDEDCKIISKDGKGNKKHFPKGFQKNLIESFKKTYSDDVVQTKISDLMGGDILVKRLLS